MDASETDGPHAGMTDLRTELAQHLAGRYEIDAEVLGAGGMAVVYGADDIRHGRRVAVKVLHPGQASIFGSQRFLREINLTAGLQHPHILPLLDSGAFVFRGIEVPYYVMPLVIGRSLQTKLDIEGRLTPVEALAIARDVAEGLQHAHDRGIVHRDVKPGNILLSASGAALIADFGVALGTASQATDMRLTAPDTSVGTPTHMSPEQLSGSSEVDPFSDQYSLATTIYEMIVGSPPYEAATRDALITKRATEPPIPVRKFRPELSLSFERALDRGLSREPKERFASVAELVAELNRALSEPASSADPPPSAPPARARKLRASRGLFVAATGLCLLAVAAWFFQRPARPVTSGRMVVLADVENLTADSTLGPALRVAAMVGLQQSSSFSTYPRSRLAASLARMGSRLTDTVLTEALAREIATRESGQAVIVLTVATLGTNYTVGSRIIDPSSGNYLATKEERAANAEDLLSAVDAVVAWTRRQLGDSKTRASPPLPMVTTPSLPALRSYAEGAAALRRSEWQVMKQALTRAIELDTGFAMAQTMLGQYYIINNRIPDGLNWLREADRRSARLTESEQLVVKSLMARAEGRTDDLIALSRTLANNFPSAANWILYGEALRAARRYPEAVAALQRAVAIDSTDLSAQYNLALAHKGGGDAPSALGVFRRVDRIDSTYLVTGFTNQVWGETYLSVGNVAAAESVFRRMLIRPAKADQARGYRSLAYLKLYQGRYDDAVSLLKNGIPLQPAGSLSEYRDVLLLADAEMMRGNTSGARTALDRAYEIFRSAEIEAAAVMFGGHQFARAGQVARARLLLDSLKARAALRPASKQDQAALAILTGELALADGKVEAARVALAGGSFDPYAALGLSLRAAVYSRLGKSDSALAMARAAAERRAFGSEMQQDWVRSIAQMARLSAVSGDSAAASESWQRLTTLWQNGDAGLPLLLEARRGARK